MLKKHRNTYISSDLRTKISLRDKGICQNCGLEGRIHVYKSRSAKFPNDSVQVFEKELFWSTFISFDISHIIPDLLGGKATSDNLVLMCQRCNRSLGAKIWQRPNNENYNNNKSREVPALQG